MRVRIAVADEIPLYRIGLEMILSKEPDFLVASPGGALEETAALTEKHSPDILIVGAEAIADGLKAAVEARQNKPRLRIVLITSCQQQESVETALQFGVAAYVLRGISAPELVQTIGMIQRGETFVTPSLAARLILAARQMKEPGGQTDLSAHTLTERERDVLRELLLGRTNKEIARNLNLTEKTIKYHMGRLMPKLNVRNRTEAALRVRGLAL